MKSHFTTQYSDQRGLLVVDGWCWYPDKSADSVSVDLYCNGFYLGSEKANRYRQDLLLAGIGNGHHSFTFQIERDSLPKGGFLNLIVAESGDHLNGSPCKNPVLEKLARLKVDPMNIEKILEKFSDLSVKHLLIDTNDSCNADCIYCPNPRSDSLLKVSQFVHLLDHVIEKVGILQIGCGQEPTLDSRIDQFFSLINQHSLKIDQLALITNGMLLHKCNINHWIQCGLNELQVSVDTLNQWVNERSRRGIHVSLVVKNLQLVRAHYPDLNISFSVTVNRLSTNGIDQLLDFGRELNVKSYYFREVALFEPESGFIRNQDFGVSMEDLLLEESQFDQLQKSLANHPEYVKIQFIPAERQNKRRSSILKT